MPFCKTEAILNSDFTPRVNFPEVLTQTREKRFLRIIDQGLDRRGLSYYNALPSEYKKMKLTEFKLSGAIHPKRGGITRLGRIIRYMPINARFSKMLMEAADRGVDWRYGALSAKERADLLASRGSRSR